jgi:hypothetical protein
VSRQRPINALSSSVRMTTPMLRLGTTLIETSRYAAD